MPKVHELTTQEKAQIYNHRIKGNALHKIALDFGITRAGVYKIVNRLEEQKTTKTR